MSFLRFILFLPILVALADLAFVNNDMVTIDLWPFYVKITISVSVLIIALSLFIFLYAKIDSWLAYSRLRSELRAQKRQNKKLNVEQKKLVEEVEGLRENIESVTPIVTKKEDDGKLAVLKAKVASWFKRKPKEEDFWCL